MVVRVFFVPENSKRADEIPASAFDFKLAPNLDGNIPAICFIYQIFERNNQLIGFHVSVQAVIMVVDRNKSHAEEGKNPLYVFPCAQMIPAKTRQVFDHNAVDMTSPDLCQHFLKCRSVKS